LSIERSARGMTTIGVLAITALQALDTTVVNVALPRIETGFGMNPEDGSWVVTAYVVATAMLAPLTGWLRRQLGARNLFALAIAGFTLASWLCAVSVSGLALIGFRFLQGATAGVLIPLSLAVLLDLYPRNRHGRISANFMAVVMIGPVLGPVLGGVLTDYVTWPWIFYVNLPVGVAALLIVWRGLAVEEREAEFRVDGVGFALMVVAIGTLQLSLQRGVGRNWLDSPELMIEGGTAVLFLAAFIRHALRADRPILQPRALTDRNFLAGTLLMFFTCAGLMATIMMIPRLAQGPLGFSATTAGLLIVPRGAATMVAALAIGPIVDRLDSRRLMAIGIVMMGMGMEMLTLLPDGSALYWLAAAGLVQGLGTGLVFAPITALTFAGMSVKARTEAMGLYSLSRILGSSFGGAVIVGLLLLRMAHHGVTPAGEFAGDLLMRDGLLHAYDDVFVVLALATMAMLPIALLFRPIARAEAAVCLSAE
jgi:DHA2 family multidrug resistance protein